MSHPRSLVEAIAAKLRQEYPAEAGHEYVFERALRGTNSRMMPDIAIFKAGQAVCVVEIGYTRPEKLTAYRDELKIPDVRWYDKQGTLHADVEERTLRLTTVVRPSGELVAYEVKDEVMCCGCNDVGVRRVPDAARDRFDRMFGAGAADHRDDRVTELEFDDVDTVVLTDYCRAWFPSYCDKCGRSWVAGELEAANLLFTLLRSPREIARAWGARTLVEWDVVRASIRESWGLEFLYADGIALKPDDLGWRQIAVHQDRARSTLDRSGSP
jgi:hypothetical protein